MEHYEHCGPHEAARPALPEVYSSEPGKLGFKPGTETIAVRVDGVLRGTALAYNVKNGWTEVMVGGERKRLKGVIKPEWV